MFHPVGETGAVGGYFSVKPDAFFKPGQAMPLPTLEPRCLKNPGQLEAEMFV